MKKALCMMLILALLLPLPVFAEEKAEPLEVSALSAVLMGPDGQVLFEKNAHARREPASVTKVMTLLLTFEALERGEIALSDPVTASAHACSMGGTQVWLEEGEQLTVEEMIKCVVLPSANDCAVALAEHLAGSETAFVARMNERAAELGMSDTTFVNACGLHADGHLTSAMDIALMSRALMQHERITDYTLLWQDSIRGGEFVLTNTNKLLRSYDGMTGLKTGYTSQAGYCISATACRDGLPLIAAVMGAESIDARSRDVAALLDYGFAAYCAYTPTPDQPLGPVRVRLGEKAELGCTAAPCAPLTVRRSDLARVEKRVELPAELAAPVRAGEPVGTLQILLDGTELAAVPLLAAEDVPRKTVQSILRELLRMLCLRKN